MKHAREDYSVVQDLTVAVELARLLLSEGLSNRLAIARRLAYEVLGLDSRGRRTDEPLWATDYVVRKIEWNEPVFLIRAQDVSSGDTVRSWCEHASKQGASKDIIMIAQSVAREMDTWPIKKVPDIPEGVRKQWAINKLLQVV